MAYAAAGVTNAFQSAGGQMEMYGAWYEGQQQRNYLRNQGLIVMEQKKEAIAKIEYQERLAAIQKMETVYQKNADDMKIEAFKDESERLVGKGIVKAAKSGADIAHGSPLDYLSYVTDERAKTTAQMSWQRDVTYWKGSVKSALTLDAANIEKAGLPMYDYQSVLYGLAGEEATRVASQKVISAGLKTGAAAASTWSGSMGGGQ